MHLIGCPRCGMELQPRFFESADFAPCRVCGTQLSVTGFPARLEPPPLAPLVTGGERGAEEAACFHHASRKAEQTCASCGKFLCALCASTTGNRVLCPECLVAGVRGTADGGLDQERTLHDSIALALGIFPSFTIWFAGFGGAAAIYVALRYWKHPGSLVRHSGWRKYLAILFGLSEIGLTIFVIVIVVAAALRGRPQ